MPICESQYCGVRILPICALNSHAADGFWGRCAGHCLHRGGYKVMR